MRTGRFAEFENSRTRRPRQPGSSGVVLTINPERAYELLPRQNPMTFRGRLKVSTVTPSAYECGGSSQYREPSAAFISGASTSERSSKFVGSISVLAMGEKTRKPYAARRKS